MLLVCLLVCKVRICYCNNALIRIVLQKVASIFISYVTVTNVRHYEHKKHALKHI
jgi:hypothetical protein